MKTFKILTCTALCAISLSACKETPVEVSGTILDATMNTITMIDSKTLDTLSFSTMDAVKDVEDGVLIGDIATVTYTGKLSDSPKADRLKVKATPALRIIGAWIEPIPGMENQNQGIRIMDEGKAESINMHTLLYKEWRLEGPNDQGKYTLTLVGSSVGNGQTIDFVTDYTIDTFTNGSLVLTGQSETLKYTKDNSVN